MKEEIEVEATFGTRHQWRLRFLIWTILNMSSLLYICLDFNNGFIKSMGLVWQDFMTVSLLLDHCTRLDWVEICKNENNM